MLQNDNDLVGASIPVIITPNTSYRLREHIHIHIHARI